ncbi:MAG: type IV pilus modification PilV family protein [Planctomycetota bacterium]|jgi:prepilin-type N-terminal cleavage/methylation domain-containing protein
MIIKSEYRIQNTEFRKFAVNVSGINMHRHSGFTLAEALIAVVILSMAAAGVLLPFSSGARVRAEGMRMTLAAGLAGDLMEKIANTPYDQIIADYDGYTEVQGQVKDAGGNVFSDPHYANFSRDVSCSYVYVDQESGTTEPVFIRATVQVNYSGRAVAVINKLINKSN